MTGALLAVIAAACMLTPRLAAATAHPPTGHPAGCGGVQTAYPRHWRGPGRPPLAIGDSTMLLALDRLAAAGFEANAHGCREFPEAISLIAQRRAAGTLPHMVLIALGADGTIGAGEIGRTLGLLCCTHLLVLVTPRELGGGSGSDAAVVRSEVASHPGRAILLDWVRYSGGHPDWFQPDGLHLTTSGAVAFTRLLATALRFDYLPYWQTGRSHHNDPPTTIQWRLSTQGDPPVSTPGHARDTRTFTTATSTMTTSTTTTQPSPPPLKLHINLHHAGRVAAALTGPAGVRVRLSERHADHLRALQTVTLNPRATGAPNGSAETPHALTWRCDVRKRTLVATTLTATAPSETVTDTVSTPSCDRRLAVSIDPRSRVGGHLTIRVHDRWGLGDTPTRICVAPPGARAKCGNWWLHHKARRSIELSTPRPGGWLVGVRGFYDRRHRRLVWAQHASGRLRMYAAGDSEMQLLDDFLKSDLAPRGVGVREDARISTGLTKPFFFDWQAQARATARSFAPDVSVIYMGANDGFSAPGRHGPSLCCAWPWSSGYASLVAQMMRTLLRGNAGRVYWTTIPAPVPGQYQGLISAVNAGIRQASRSFPGRVALIDLNAIMTPGNRYRDHMTWHGHGFTIHESDGVHISVSADRVAAQIIEGQLRADRILR